MTQTQTPEMRELLPCPFCGGPAMPPRMWNGALETGCDGDHDCPGSDVLVPVAAWNRRALSAPSPVGPVTEVVIEPDALVERIRQAYVAGCEAVHENYQPDAEPDFTEASYDYAASLDFTEDTRPAPTSPPQATNSEVERLKLEPQYCDFCGASPETEARCCAPPFKVQPHQWTGKHPADRAALAHQGVEKS
jgi:hypothetical protein